MHGFAADQVISALQKEIRRGHTDNAVLLAYEMARTSPALEDYLWQRLLVIAVEDIGFGELQAPILLHALHQTAPASGVGRAVGQQKPHRPAGLLRQPRHPGEFACLILEIAVHPEGASAGGAQGAADAGQLGLLGLVARDQLAGGRLVRIGARGRETERAGADRRLGQTAHSGDVVGGRGLAVDAALAHDVNA